MPGLHGFWVAWYKSPRARRTSAESQNGAVTMKNTTRPRSNGKGGYLTTLREQDGKLVADIYAGYETRTVEVEPCGYWGRLETARVFVAKARTGAKLWPTTITLWPVGMVSNDENLNAVPVVGADYSYHHSVTILNRASYQVAGWDDEKYSAHHSRHNSAHRSKI